MDVHRTVAPESDQELMIRPIVRPLIENGEQIYEEMIQQLSETLEWQQLTEEEKNEILDFDDQQMAELSLIFTQPVVARMSADDIFKCAASALGISEAVNIYRNTVIMMSGEFSATIATKSALQLLKTVGRRYLGWVGLGYAVILFVDCVS